MNKDSRIVELLYQAVQNGKTLTITEDLSGMLTVSWGPNLEDHTHVGVPHGDYKQLERDLINLLAERSEA